MSMEDYDFLFKIVLIGNAGVGKTCLVRRFTQGLFPPGQGATIGVDFMIKTVEINGEKVKERILDDVYTDKNREWLRQVYPVSCHVTSDIKTRKKFVFGSREPAQDIHTKYSSVSGAMRDNDRMYCKRDCVGWGVGNLANLKVLESLPEEALQIWDTAGQERFRSITQSYYRSANALILTYDITCEESFRCLPEWLREIEQYASNKVITVLVGNKIDLAERREVSQQRAEEFSEAQDMYYLETSAKESDNVEKLFLDLACRLISEARQNTLVNNVSSPLPGEGKSISYLTCCNFN
ncbi:Ras- protein Rab-30 [Saguinus oedipus]|uniref:Ras- protein Rab-30 n=2 Tax=Boreoeutheria TaxID=1437010 RepID=A0ABQ9UVF5_SAGOE|nr:Ras- protein Rab-30 [Saguinus oedipus]